MMRRASFCAILAGFVRVIFLRLNLCGNIFVDYRKVGELLKIGHKAFFSNLLQGLFQLLVIHIILPNVKESGKAVSAEIAFR